MWVWGVVLRHYYPLFLLILVLLSMLSVSTTVSTYRMGGDVELVIKGIGVTSGSILAGKVYDADGKPLYNALVKLQNRSFSITTYTDVNGVFTIDLSSVASGYYNLSVHKFGYNDLVVPIKVYPAPWRIAIVGDYMDDLRSVFEPLGYTLDSYTALSDLLGEVNRYKVIIFNDFGSDPGYSDLVEIMDEASEWNVTLIFLDSWDYSDIEYWHSLYTLYNYNSQIESSGYPAPDEREDYYPDGSYVRVRVLEPNHPVFTGIVYDADETYKEFYLGEHGSQYMDYAYDDFNDDSNVTVLAYVRDLDNNVFEQCLVEYKISDGAPWYYFSAGASFRWVMYNADGDDNRYSYNTRQLLINLVLYPTGYLNSSAIEGYVYNKSSGQPIESAIIELVELGYNTTTDENGYFKFTDINPGQYTLEVEAEGFYTYTQPVSARINGTTKLTIDLLSENETSWLVLVYLDGDNDLEDAAIEDLNEMELIGSGNGVEIVVLFDRHPGYDSSNGDWAGTRLYHVTYDTDTSTINSEQLKLWTGNYEEELNMGDPATLENFIEYVYGLYGGEHIALILWNHGSGFESADASFGIRNVAYDYSDGDSLDEGEILNVLKDLSASGIHIDLLAMDACLMGMIEIAYEYYGLVDVYVASEETVPGDGYEYDLWLDDLVSKPSMTPEQLGEVLVQAYEDRYSGYSDVSLSAIDVDEVHDHLLPAINYFSQYAIDHMADLVDDLQQARDNAQAFYYSDYKDLVDLMYKVKSYTSDQELSKRADYVIGNVTPAVIAEWHSSDLDAYGLSIWFPEQSSWSSYESEYRDMLFSADGLWDDMLETFFSYGGSSEKPRDHWINRFVNQPSRSFDWYNVVYLDRRSPTPHYIELTLSPRSDCGWIEVGVEGSSEVIYIDFHGVNDSTALSRYVITGTVKIYVPPGTYIVRLWSMGGNPVMYRLDFITGTRYNIVYRVSKLKAALIGGDETLADYLSSHGIAVDTYENYTLFNAFGNYSVIIVNKWDNTTPGSNDVVRFLKYSLGNGSSVILLDTYDPYIVSGAYVVCHYRDTMVLNDIPVPGYRYMSLSSEPVEYRVNTRHPVNDPYGPGEHIQLYKNSTQYSRVYYSEPGNASIMGYIVEGYNVLGEGIIAYNVNNTAYLVYVSFGASGINAGEDYSVDSKYTSDLEELVVRTIESLATSPEIEAPAPIPENNIQTIIPVAIVLIAIVAVLYRIAWSRNRCSK